MKIQDSIRIGYRDYQIDAIPQNHWSEVGVVGLCKFDPPRIEYRADLEGSKLIETLQHEIWHAIDFEFTCDLEDCDDEKAISRLSACYEMVIIQNPWWRKVLGSDR